MRRILLGILFACLLAGAMAFTVDSNIYLLGRRDFTSPQKIYIGPDMDNGLYIFVQERVGGIWAGLETFKRPPQDSPANGYGHYPLRLWGSNILAEENGILVVREVVAQKIILQTPILTPEGGITWNPLDLQTYITRDGTNVILYVAGIEVDRWPKVAQ